MVSFKEETFQIFKGQITAVLFKLFPGKNRKIKKIFLEKDFFRKIKKIH